MSELSQSPERYARLKEVYLAVRELELERREERLEQLCAGDRELREAARELLTEDTRTGHEFERLLANVVPRKAPEAESLPPRIGKYLIRERLGHGGMGVVYLALQEDLGRLAALKLLRSDSLDEAARERFAREARTLGRLHHPGIAAIYESGVVEDEVGARPWFAMEYVRGATLLEHARERQLGLRSRVELVASACEAVAAAHREGVVHRDLKPGNILVDEAGVAKVLDGGVARALHDSHGEASLTLSGQVVGTIEYMSPEQAGGERAHIDARTDVYALGVVLYQLISESLPHDTHGLLAHEALRRVREDEPTALRLRAPGTPRDLEAVVATALAREPARRYSDAGEFRDDLRRFLSGEPVRARPPSVVYQLSRLVHRHRTLAAGLAATFAALAVGLAVSLVALKRARDAENLAQEREVGMLRLADQRRLDDLLGRADSLFPAEPELVLELERWLGEAEELGARLPLHRAFLSSLRAEALALPAGERSPERAWLIEVQERLIARLEEFVGDGSGAARLDELRHRTEFARTLRERSVVAFATEWERACAAIAASPRYGGLVLAPQPGLVPLGADPDSGLEEFALFELTGPMPRRDPVTRRLELADDFGIVLVLIPGGLGWIGAQSEDPALPNYDTAVWSNAGPPHLVAFEPFFLSKYEVTKGQWRAAGFGEPSYLKIGGSAYDAVHTPRFPVDSIAWVDAARRLPALGLQLPTEAQWEFAARGGSVGGWSTGDSYLDLMGAANLSDTRDEWAFPECHSDGYFGWGPVGAFRANPLGLHDVHGGVYEWCRETYWVRQYDFPARYGDGLRLVPEDTLRVARGGSCFDTARVASSHYRSDFLAHSGNNQIGLRPARPLRGNWSWPGP